MFACLFRGVGPDAIRSKVYESFFGATNPVSTQWGYDAILQKLPDEATILDVGCGDGVYFTNAKVIETIKAKKLRISAIDIDAGAVEICKKRIKKAGLGELIDAEARSVTDVSKKYDFVLWMESFPVIEPSLFGILFKHSLTLTKKKTMLYHNLVEEGQASWIIRKIKPLLKYFTLVDFGKLTTVTEMRQTLQGLTDRSFAIRPLLTCPMKDMHVTALVSSILLNLYKKGEGDREIVQYLVEVRCTMTFRPGHLSRFHFVILPQAIYEIFQVDATEARKTAA